MEAAMTVDSQFQACCMLILNSDVNRVGGSSVEWCFPLPDHCEQNDNSIHNADDGDK